MPLPQAILKVEQDREKFSWIEDLGLHEPIPSFPLDAEEVSFLLDKVNDPAFTEREPYSGEAILNPSSFASSAEFQSAVARLQDTERMAQSARAAADPAFLSVCVSAR